MSGSTRCRLRRSWAAGHQPGQSVVELALIMVVLVPLLIGAVDLGRAYFEYDILADAANEDARRASFDKDTAKIISTTREASGRLDIPAGNVTIACFSGTTGTVKDPCNLAMNDVVQVTATWPFTPITPYVTALLPGGTLTIWASARRTYQ